MKELQDRTGRSDRARIRACVRLCTTARARSAVTTQGREGLSSPSRRVREWGAGQVMGVAIAWSGTARPGPPLPDDSYHKGYAPPAKPAARSVGSLARLSIPTQDSGRPDSCRMEDSCLAACLGAGRPDRRRRNIGTRIAGKRTSMAGSAHPSETHNAGTVGHPAAPSVGVSELMDSRPGNPILGLSLCAPGAELS